MKLYLIRHGIAEELKAGGNDRHRSLTDLGRQRTTQVAHCLRQFNLWFDLILTSPLSRAQQTAEILAAVGLSQCVQINDCLAPEGDFQDWLTWLDTWHSVTQHSVTQHSVTQHQDQPSAAPTHQTLAIVGHEPNLSCWAEILCWGQSQNSLRLKKAGVIGLMLPDRGNVVGRSQLFWLAPPKFLANPRFLSDRIRL